MFRRSPGSLQRCDQRERARERFWAQLDRGGSLSKTRPFNRPGTLRLWFLPAVSTLDAPTNFSKQQSRPLLKGQKKSLREYLRQAARRDWQGSRVHLQEMGSRAFLALRRA